MIDTFARYLQNLHDTKSRRALELLLRPIHDRYSSQALSNSTLVIKAGSSAVAKTGAADSYYLVKGKLVTIAASTDMPALTGLRTIVTTNTVNVYCYFVDVAGTVTAVGGVPAVTLGNVVFPSFPEGKALVGFILVTMAAAATFTPGVTALDAANTTVVYFSPTGPFDPSVLLGN